MPTQSPKRKAAAKKRPAAKKTRAGKRTAVGLARPPAKPAPLAATPRAVSDGEGPKVANAEREGEDDAG